MVYVIVIRSLCTYTNPEMTTRLPSETELRLLVELVKLSLMGYELHPATKEAIGKDTTTRALRLKAAGVSNEENMRRCRLSLIASAEVPETTEDWNEWVVETFPGHAVSEPSGIWEREIFVLSQRRHEDRIASSTRLCKFTHETMKHNFIPTIVLRNHRIMRMPLEGEGDRVATCVAFLTRGIYGNAQQLVQKCTQRLVEQATQWSFRFATEAAGRSVEQCLDDLSKNNLIRHVDLLVDTIGRVAVVVCNTGGQICVPPFSKIVPVEPLLLWYNKKFCECICPWVFQAKK